MKQTTRLFLDDINQCWSKRNLISGGVSSNSYTRDIYHHLSKILETSEEQSKYLRQIGVIK